SISNRKPSLMSMNNGLEKLEASLNNSQVETETSGGE
ncbi:MAG: hypothetical protein A07HN63_01086, partial [uncultured archaeon A07HN63]